MNYYTFHIGDYIRDTSHLTLIEDAIYRRCLDWYYTNESPLPNDYKKIARLIRASEFLEEVKTIVNEFFVLDGDGFAQRRCNDEISTYHEKAQKARENGQKGGRPKTKTKPNHNQTLTDSVILANQTLTDSVILANQTLTESKANQEPITNNNNNTREADFIEKVTTDNRKRFAIGFDWRPDKQMFAAYCQRKLVKPCQLSEDLFKRFVDKVSAKGEVKTEAQWCENLASYLKTCLSNPPKPTQQPKSDYTNMPPPLEPIRPMPKVKLTPEQRAEQDRLMAELIQKTKMGL